ncbi:serine/threonine-protein kinase [Streptomyces pactum]|uniref:serine/threonine-protein kinase n=1 Tax=Streptomyces pactum TaxID=68249 RepID=UPI001E5A3BEB|nr:serine/threonine-protein kinase [Streptomyces pactum]
MGVVFLARSSSGRRVAVKVVHEQFAQDEEFRVRFRQEVAAARRVSGAFTAPVVDADPDAERPWMATLHVPGPTLAEHLTTHGPPHLDRPAPPRPGTDRGLHDIHRAGVIHRDLKPANVLMAPRRPPRVIDFGISRAADSQALTVTGRVMGTPPFMSPEQLSRPPRRHPPPPTSSPSAHSWSTPPPDTAPSTPTAPTSPPTTSSTNPPTSPTSPTPPHHRHPLPHQRPHPTTPARPDHPAAA